MLFAWLMLLQWLGGVAVAIWISPRTWIGTASEIHIHVWVAVLLGGAISSLPIYLALSRPGSAVTRFVIASAQMLFSALLIHLCGGRIETHFHVFGSFALLAAYRDWRVLLTAILTSYSRSCDSWVVLARVCLWRDVSKFPEKLGTRCVGHF